MIVSLIAIPLSTFLFIKYLQSAHPPLARAQVLGESDANVCAGKDQGDADCDGDVDALDYTIWRSEFLDQSVQEKRADFNGDAVVDEFDFETWRSTFANQPSVPTIDPTTFPALSPTLSPPSSTTFDKTLCPPNGIVDCTIPQPGIALCTEGFIKWAQDNCDNFIGAAY